jgi:hypothetical protein
MNLQQGVNSLTRSKESQSCDASENHGFLQSSLSSWMLVFGLIMGWSGRLYIRPYLQSLNNFGYDGSHLVHTTILCHLSELKGSI